MTIMKDGCVQPARGPIAPETIESGQAPVATGNRTSLPMARVGKPAPDFEAGAFVAGHGFQPVKLSDYKGQWIVLCFYPGDFTFV